jgi:hypothetical protein
MEDAKTEPVEEKLDDHVQIGLDHLLCQRIRFAKTITTPISEEMAELLGEIGSLIVDKAKYFELARTRDNQAFADLEAKVVLYEGLLTRIANVLKDSKFGSYVKQLIEEVNGT